jgi:hypothetical protein
MLELYYVIKDAEKRKKERERGAGAGGDRPAQAVPWSKPHLNLPWED